MHFTLLYIKTVLCKYTWRNRLLIIITDKKQICRRIERTEIQESNGTSYTNLFRSLLKTLFTLFFPHSLIQSPFFVENFPR